jgi:putative transposase
MGHRRYRFINQEVPRSTTCTMLDWMPVFSHPETIEIIR